MAEGDLSQRVAADAGTDPATSRLTLRMGSIVAGSRAGLSGRRTMSGLVALGIRRSATFSLPNHSIFNLGPSGLVANQPSKDPTIIKLNAGFSRKVGEPNCGSRGASVNVELEVESSLIGDPESLMARIRKLFDIARQSVDAELANGSPNINPGAANREGHRRDDRSDGGRGGNG